MSLSSPTPPAIPSATGTASAQQGYNTQAGEASQAGSMVNQSNSWGTTTYAQTGTGANGTPIYSASTSLSPEQQQLYDEYTALQQQGGGQANNLLTGANYGSVSPATAIGNDTSGLTQTAMGEEMNYLKPYFNYQTTQNQTQLANEGFDPSSPAWQQSMLNLENQQNNTVTGFEAQIEPQMYQQAQQNYMLPEELAMSLGGISAPTSPVGSEVSAPGLTIQPANYEGQVQANQQQAQQQYGTQVGLEGATLGAVGSAIGGIGGAATFGMMQNPSAISNLFTGSDARIKENIEHEGTLPNGVNYYSFNFKGDHHHNRHMGLIAQDVETKRPHAVAHDAHGIKYVNYAEAMR